MIRERLEQLRKSMKEAGIDCYLIPTSDYHDSEYVSSFFMVRKYFSGFTGSAGTLVVTGDEAVLFTDGRYFIQADKELAGSGILLMKMGEPGVPTLKEYLKSHLLEGQCLGFDGRVVKADEAVSFEEILEKKKGRLCWKLDLTEEIWTDRPPLIHHPAYLLKECYSGLSTGEKLKRVREKIQAEGADIHLLTSLDDIAWLLNLRGSDVEYCPVVLAYAVITMEQVLLFTGEGIFKAEDSCSLCEDGVELCPYDDFYPYLSKIHGKRVLLCEGRVSCRLMKELSEDVTVIDRPNPTTLMKAVKNPVEIENLRTAHLKDGIAVTRFLYWLKTNIGKLPITEVSAAKQLEAFRRQQEHFLEPSFETICAYGSNGAIIHYSALPEDCAELKREGFVMVDSGGHYLEGSTDVTRTIALGPVSEEEKRHYTLVLRAMLNLKSSVFLHGCRGINLDIRAREILWEQGLDYKHGTGHGVGYLLNVHEGPNSFRWKLMPDYQDNAVLEEGMVTTDEPGIYIEGSHGIRIENELLCRKGEQNEYGQFMYFEDLTCVPIDLDCVEVSMLEERDRQRLNEYHRQVYEKLSPYFTGDELVWLKEATREV